MSGFADAEQVHAETAAQWREWLAANHTRDAGVWLVFWRRVTGKPAMTYNEAILESLAYGWIDGQSMTLDDERSMLWFRARNPRSPWSRVNKGRIEVLEREGRMAPPGRAAIDTAKSNGMWSVLDDADELVVPPDLAAALEERDGASANWTSCPPSVRRLALRSLAMAKRADTRAKRLADIADTCARGARPGR